MTKKKQEVSVKYKFRCVSGKDVPGEAFGNPDDSKETVIAELKKSYSRSITPLSEIDGKPVDLTEFLTNLISDANLVIKELTARRDSFVAELKDRTRRL